MLSQLLTPEQWVLAGTIFGGCSILWIGITRFLLARQELEHKQALLNRERAHTSAIMTAKWQAYKAAYEHLVGYPGAEGFAEKFGRAFAPALGTTEGEGDDATHI